MASIRIHYIKTIFDEIVANESKVYIATYTYAEIPGHMIVLLELIQNNRFVWGNRCYVIIGLMAQILSY